MVACGYIHHKYHQQTVIASIPRIFRFAQHYVTSTLGRSCSPGEGGGIRPKDI